MVGKNLRKGIFAFRDMKMGGYNLCIVWLKRDYASGEKYALEDIDKIDGCLHFCDRESVENTIKVLKWILKQGIKE
jgi:hypothetical protein